MNSPAPSVPTFLVTGGAGFIGSALVYYLVQRGNARIVTVDALTYAGNIHSLAAVLDSDNHVFVHADICDQRAIERVFEEHQPTAVFHLAAETHVDRSIDGPGAFMHTNVLGTFTMLQASLRHWRAMGSNQQEKFRFIHVSTDEVFGSLAEDSFFTEQSPYDPSSPYAASKAAADHLVRAWHRTYGLPAIVTNCSNNYGPRQFPEKLIPLALLRARAHQSIPVYSRGQNVRDWLFVDDHVRALALIADTGLVGETYLVGAGSPSSNIDTIRLLCRLLEEECEVPPPGGFATLIEFVSDRPGHDLRYAIDASHVRSALGWEPRESLESGLRKTIRWYLDNGEWLRQVRSAEVIGTRLGLGASR